MFDEPEEQAEAEVEAPEEIDSGEFFCRFTPMQFDRMANYWLGEMPLCEAWVSKDGKEAVLRGLRLRTTKRKAPDTGKEYVIDMVEKWKQRFGKTAKPKPSKLPKTAKS